jgi:hypothetical protein
MFEQEREGHEFRACPSDAANDHPEKERAPGPRLALRPVIFITDSLIVSVIEFL